MIIGGVAAARRIRVAGHLAGPRRATFSTPNAVMVIHAGPSRGSAELAMWRVRMAPAAQGPVHLIDREQVYLVMAGVLSILVGDEDHRAETGDR